MADNQQLENVPAQETTSQDQTATDLEALKAQVAALTAENADIKAASRKWEERAKANKDAAPQLGEMAEQLEAARKQAEETANELKAMQAAKARLDAVNQVAAETGVPAGVISAMKGSTVEELTQAAELVKQTMPLYPGSPNEGRKPGSVGQTKQDILNIKNDRARRKAILDNLNQF